MMERNGHAILQAAIANGIFNCFKQLAAFLPLAIEQMRRKLMRLRKWNQVVRQGLGVVGYFVIHQTCPTA
ncbi:protein of unknown function [Vibrio tapetis subsp. tapetis]|uniref:Uncharacterized protein n=1 Tax=Vibrio tapetis subsp. tapetis TaxID=1671868 RepID=A0A2N8ZIP9_9VIBR|nr:protein of unknown function [Vibrio tapetis subsp. tapetis]